MKTAIITVPYITTDKHYESTLMTYTSLSTVDYLKIAVINRIRETDLQLIEDHNDVVIRNDKNILARAWNMGIQEAIKNACDLFIIPNLDVMATENAILHLAKITEENHIASLTAKNSLSQFYMHHKHSKDELVDIVDDDQSFSFFAITRKAYEDIGEFDENFIPAYYEDRDYLLRSKQKGYSPKRSLKYAFYHELQGTTKNGDGFNDAYHSNLIKNETYFKKKHKVKWKQ